MEYVISLEGGATHSRAGLYDDGGVLLREAEGGPANPVAYGVVACARTTAHLVRTLLDDIMPAEAGLYAAYAGASDPDLQRELASAIGQQTQLRCVFVTSDLHAMLHANAGTGPGILVIAGTGAAVLARDADGRLLRTGGWGALLGDDGSGYAVAVSALRACARALDCVAANTTLVELLPAAAGLNSFEEFVGWSARVTKREIASLTPTVAAAAEAGDIAARSCMEEEARRLAALALVAQERLELEHDVRLFEYGALLEQCALFRDAFREAAACYGDMQHLACTVRGHGAVYTLTEMERVPRWAFLWRADQVKTSGVLPVTERSGEQPFLDELAPSALVETLHRADHEAADAVDDVLDAVGEAVEQAAACLRRGGRILYVGAGTSGRLAVLDAAECPPTFGVGADRVAALIAGGARALRHSVEGAEDDSALGAAEVQALGVAASDFVVGVAASGTTPYVLGALETARAVGAPTALITSNTAAVAPVDILIAPDTGPEALPGSTRLKAGTAAKMILNMISTGAMALSGYVYKGRMIGMIPANEKLRARARRIVSEITGTDEAQAAAALEACGYHIATAILMIKRVISAEEAGALLARQAACLRDAIESE